MKQNLINSLFADSPVVMLAPMAGFSDRAMRVVCSSFGADLAVTEMVSAKAVVFGSSKTMMLARIGDREGRVGLQIFGNDPSVMAEAAARLSVGFEGSFAPSFIDINMGCPMQKIFGNSEGSALMRDPSLIERIVKATNEATPLPVTVKIRSGIDPDHINAVECALAAQSGGAAMICVHGRTRVQLYSGLADREIIKAVKDSVHIPVIANGDIVSAESALQMLAQTGADGIAIGRGAVGNPFIFAQIKAALRSEEYSEPGLCERIETALLQLQLACEDKGERIAVPEARKQIASYLHTFPGAAAIRARVNNALTYSEVEQILREELKAIAEK